MNRLHAAREIAPDHPAFAGHFPGQPLLPGVALLAEVMEAAQAEPVLAARLAGVSTLQQAKFLSPVRPGDRLHVDLQWDDAGLRFEVRCGERVAARGQWGWSAAQAAAARPANGPGGGST
jgi:3-hydroxymyristoyl/3-hydroxydecanoyl-(acyl carrier protein) dehydratase